MSSLDVHCLYRHCRDYVARSGPNKHETAEMRDDAFLSSLLFWHCEILATRSDLTAATTSMSHRRENIVTAHAAMTSPPEHNEAAGGAAKQHEVSYNAPDSIALAKNKAGRVNNGDDRVFCES